MGGGERVEGVVVGGVSGGAGFSTCLPVPKSQGQSQKMDWHCFWFYAQSLHEQEGEGKQGACRNRNGKTGSEWRK